MRKTILMLAMMLMLALTATAGPAMAAPSSKSPVALKGDSVVVGNGDKAVTVSKMDLKRVNERIQEALDDTLTAGDGLTVEIDDRKGELSPQDVKVISEQWASVVENIGYASIVGLLALVLIILLFRYLTRRRRYRVIERAIENNYPLNELSLSDVKRSAIYVQPTVTAAPAHPGQVPVGTPLQGQSAAAPIVMPDVVNWRALMPAVKWLAWGVLLVLFSVAIGEGGEDPFWPIGLVLIFVGVCKGIILYKEQQTLRRAWNRAEQQRAEQYQQEPMREGIPVPPAFDQGNKVDDF